jgi:hypothetical protein
VFKQTLWRAHHIAFSPFSLFLVRACVRQHAHAHSRARAHTQTLQATGLARIIICCCKPFRKRAIQIYIIQSHHFRRKELSSSLRFNKTRELFPPFQGYSYFKYAIPDNSQLVHNLLKVFILSISWFPFSSLSSWISVLVFAVYSAAS